MLSQWTVKTNWPEEAPPGLITSTLQVCAAVVKMGLITIWVALNELIGRLANTSPVVRSRSVTVAPDTKLLPLMVKGCALLEPVTGFGLTLLIVGVSVGLQKASKFWPPMLLPDMTTGGSVEQSHIRSYSASPYTDRSRVL